MKRPILLLLFSLSFATIITVDDDGPADYSIIQDAIDVSVDGDTVLVNRGFYQENLLIDKSITLASHAIYDNLTNLESWTQYDTNIFEWQVINDNINETIIDGSAPIDENYGSCILIYNNEDNCITPTITGFTIQNGIGTEVILNPETPEEQIQTIGGGILVILSNPTIHYNQLINNGSHDLYIGGGMYLSTEPEDIGFENYLRNRARCDVEEFDLSNNMYDGNEAQYGNTLSNRFYENGYDMSQSIFDVANCQADEVSPVWVHIEPEAVANFSESESNLCATTASDVYVDPNIDQECIIDGCGEENNPFKTITWALAMIMPSEDNPVTLHLANGTYSPETGEVFPLLLPNYVSLEGNDEALTIIDAMQTEGVILIYDNDISFDISLSYFTVIGGSGRGIRITGENNDNLTLNHITISNNMGGGISITGDSDPTLTNVTIVNNTADNGGGMYVSTHYTTLINVTIANNTANNNESAYLGNGGGIFVDLMADIYIFNTIIWNNEPESIYHLFEYDIMGNSYIRFSNIECPDVDCTLLYWGIIDADPLFTDSENGDFTLQEGSPCIDAGTSSYDIYGEVFIDIDESEYYGLAPDMGAFESLFISLGDVDGDQVISILDIIIIIEIIIEDYNPLDQEYSASDFNEDGIVDILDIILIVNYVLNN